MFTQKPQDQYIKVGQINIRFWASGDEGAAVILLHGLGGSVEHWEHNINALAQLHRVYALDWVGFGRSDKPPITPSYSLAAQFLSDFMEVQHIERASLIGNSMGGGVTLQFAIQFSDKVSKLVLVASAGLGKELGVFLRLVSLPLIGEFLTRPSRKGIVQLWKNIVYDPTLITDELVESFYQMAALPGAQKSLLSALRSGVNLFGQHTDIIRSIINNLGTITAPTLVIWGQQDGIIPVAHIYVAQEKIPHAEVQILDYCGHLPQFECPNEFNAIVQEFLDR